jgi:GTPase SAR1 family protein
MEGRSILMNITRGKILSAQKVIIYGPEGIGKSTFASKFPDPLFIDTEGSTKHMDVARLPRPTSWAMLMEEVQEVKKEGLGICKTLVIDTADWAEQLCIIQVCSKAKKSGIEDFAYGKGYVYVAEEFGRLLNLLEDIANLGINIVITAHAKMRKFEQPDDMGAYDRWEMKLSKNSAPMLKEWADAVLFANYKTYVVADSNNDKVHKAQGGKRVMYTAHHPCWDAKNRYDMPDEVPFEYSAIAPYIMGENKKAEMPMHNSNQHTVEPPQKSTDSTSSDSAISLPNNAPAVSTPDSDSTNANLKSASDLTGIPQALADLMNKNEVAPIELQTVIGQKGYFPADMPITDYPPDFVQEVLIAAWDQVFSEIQNHRNDDLPF